MPENSNLNPVLAALILIGTVVLGSISVQIIANYDKHKKATENMNEIEKLLFITKLQLRETFLLFHGKDEK